MTDMASIWLLANNIRRSRRLQAAPGEIIKRNQRVQVGRAGVLRGRGSESGLKDRSSVRQVQIIRL